MDRLAKLIIRLQRLGYRTQTFGDKMVLELDVHSRMRGSSEQIERILPALEKGANNVPGTAANRFQKKGSTRASSGRGRFTGLKNAKTKGKKKKIILTSARVPTLSIETQRGRATNWRKSRSSGGLPGLGKHR